MPLIFVCIWFQAGFRNGLLGVLFFVMGSYFGEMSAVGDIRVPKLFCDSMVLQRQADVHLYGSADPDEALVLTITGAGTESRELKTTCNAQGEFSFKFAPPPVGGPYELAITGLKSKVVIGDVLVGDVWLCAGQSNMGWPISKSDPAEMLAVDLPRPQLRLLTIPQTASPQPLHDVTGSVGWAISTPETAAEFSAVGWHFGQVLEQELQVPIGLIHASWGGTKAEAWISMDALVAEPSLQPLIDNAKSLSDGIKPQDHLSSLYNGMIAPLRDFPIKGVVWYQGEANVGRGHQYRTLLPLLIDDWRKQWNAAHLPFLFVQLAPYRYNNHPSQALPELWDAQLAVYKSVARTGMVVTTDLGNFTDIHPVKKQEVGQRLAAWAKAEVYHGRQLLPADRIVDVSPTPGIASAFVQTEGMSTLEPIIYSGPLFRQAHVQNDRIVVEFLAGQGLTAVDGEPLREFLVAGEDQVFHPAMAVIDADRVVVSSELVPKPIAVRYCWRDTPSPNLVNGVGLPASPFRSDNFALVPTPAQ